MRPPALEEIVRAAGGRIVAALAARFQNLDIAEDTLADACLKAATTWPVSLPADPAAWLYRVAYRTAIGALRRQRVRERLATELAMPAEETAMEDFHLTPDERLRLIFICCHPAVAPEARAALTLRLVCGLPTAEIARAFLISEPTLAQRLVRAKRKIAEAGVPFELPSPRHWTDRLDAVLSMLEIAYSRMKTPDVMVPLAEQDPARWSRKLIEEADGLLARGCAPPAGARSLQAALHGMWCGRTSLAEPPPWASILRIYDQLLGIRNDAIVRLNRSVALAEVRGADAALREVESLGTDRFGAYLPYHAVKADLLRRLSRPDDARAAYDAALALGPTSAERRWLERQRASLA